MYAHVNIWYSICVYILKEPPSELRASRFIRNGPLTPKGCGGHEKRWGPHPERCPNVGQLIDLPSPAAFGRVKLSGDGVSERCPNDARSDGATLAKHTWARQLVLQGTSANAMQRAHSHTTQTRYSRCATTSSMGSMLGKLCILILYSIHVKDGTYLHFTTRMHPLSPNPIKRWGPHPERCPGLSDN